MLFSVTIFKWFSVQLADGNLLKTISGNTRKTLVHIPGQELPLWFCDELTATLVHMTVLKFFPSTWRWTPGHFQISRIWRRFSYYFLFGKCKFLSQAKCNLGFPRKCDVKGTPAVWCTYTSNRSCYWGPACYTVNQTALYMQVNTGER